MQTVASGRGAAGRPGTRHLLALAIALVALIVAVEPVVAAEHYRSTAALRTGDGARYGTAYLDRYFGGSPVGPTKTTVRVRATGLEPSTRTRVLVAAGECFSEGMKLASFYVTTSSTGTVNKTTALGTSYRRKVQQAYDRGYPVIVVVDDGHVSLCGPFGDPQLVQ
jgi:hypothetical protein